MPSSSSSTVQRLSGSLRGSRPVVSHSKTSSPFIVISAGGAMASFFWKMTCGSWFAVPLDVQMLAPHASACALVPPKPKEETPEYAASSRIVVTSESTWHGKPSKSKCGFLAFKCTLDAASQCMTCMQHLKKPASPAPPSPWAMFDLEDVMTIGCCLGVTLITFLKEPTSIGSPSDVPVPWHSKQSTSVGVSWHSLSTELMHFSCAGPFGAVRLALRPS
mmetsp:Transcript_24368/g.73197  ORF Transcript_24368/g.73197 Transcript_24368/m.73197 type:complete len:219 (+) Transcript_24368:366-1022(+)